MCVASLKSMTLSIKAKKILSSIGIDSEIIRLEPQMTHKGCAYGIKFNCINLNSVQDALKSKNLEYSDIIRL
jgi:hypothetical protein